MISSKQRVLLHRLVPSDVSKSYFHKTRAIRNNLPNDQASLGQSRSKFSRYLLVGTGVPVVGFLGYYQLVLDSQERRKVKVNVKSVGRAARSFTYGAITAADYKWNLWGVDEVNLIIKIRLSLKENPVYRIVRLIMKR